MTTVASRLHELTGLTGATFAQHLLALAAGNTVATVLAAWSGLTGATMAQHLMADGGVQTPAPSGGSWVASPRRYRPKDEDEALLLFVL